MTFSKCGYFDKSLSTVETSLWTFSLMRLSMPLQPLWLSWKQWLFLISCAYSVSNSEEAEAEVCPGSAVQVGW